MKTLISILIVMVLTSCHSTSPTPYRNEIVELQTFLGKYTISGFAVGDGADPGEFYLLAKQIAEKGNQEQFRSMLNDSCPAVRAMGLVCLAKHDYHFEVLQDDNEEITATPFGCCGIHMTMEEFSIRLKNDEVFRACFTGPEELAVKLMNKQSESER